VRSETVSDALAGLRLGEHAASRLEDPAADSAFVTDDELEEGATGAEVVRT
jgi:hypothetical protein